MKLLKVHRRCERSLQLHGHPIGRQIPKQAVPRVVRSGPQVAHIAGNLQDAGVSDLIVGDRHAIRDLGVPGQTARCPRDKTPTVGQKSRPVRVSKIQQVGERAGRILQHWSNSVCPNGTVSVRRG